MSKNSRGEDRLKIWEAYIEDGGLDHKNVKHMFVDYSRYYESDCIILELKHRGVDFTKFKVLDYGCGIGDYGIEFCRNAAKEVAFYDFPRSTNFVGYRLALEKLKNGSPISVDHIKFKNFHKTLGDYDLIIFGEVLEHLHNPLAVLKMCNLLKVKYIFTSSYPYRTDDPNDPYWHNHDHSDDARKMMPECRELLEQNYDYVKFGGELRLWTRKPALQVEVKDKILDTKSVNPLVPAEYA